MLSGSLGTGTEAPVPRDTGRGETHQAANLDHFDYLDARDFGRR
jgi:hypothetical protein